MLINQWYVLANSDEVCGEPIRVHALGQDFVLFRDAADGVHCLSDICVHKGASLSCGKVVENAVVCPYHGWQFDGNGTCIKIPSLVEGKKIPKRARIDSYPVKEKWGWIWAFLGDASEQERPPLPDFFPEFEQQTGAWRFARGRAHFDCNWVRAVENGVDRAHAVFVHADFGNPESPEVEDYEIEDSDNRIYGSGSGAPLNKRGVWRDAIPDERDDREVEVQIFVPAPCIRIQMHMQATMSQIIVTAYTPIEEGRTQLNFIQARNFLTDEKYDEDSLKRVYFVIEEDANILKHLKPTRIPPSLADELLLSSDHHGTVFRQKVKEMEEKGLAIDTEKQCRDSERVQVIPSPLRKEDPNSWVFKSIPMRNNITNNSDYSNINHGTE